MTLCNDLWRIAPRKAMLERKMELGQLNLNETFASNIPKVIISCYRATNKCFIGSPIILHDVCLPRRKSFPGVYI